MNVVTAKLQKIVGCIYAPCVRFAAKRCSAVSSKFSNLLAEHRLLQTQHVVHKCTLQSPLRVGLELADSSSAKIVMNFANNAGVR
jgi:hypothetical protein